MTAVATVADLYRTSGVFRAGIEKWVADLRCPLEMGDFLEEHGLPSAADCARWAATKEDRPQWSLGFPDCGPFPFCWDYTGWCWTVDQNQHYAHRIPPGNISIKLNGNGGTDGHNSPAHAILWLLDAWVTSLIAGAPIRPGQLVTLDETGNVVPYPDTGTPIGKVI